MLMKVCYLTLDIQVLFCFHYSGALCLCFSKLKNISLSLQFIYLFLTIFIFLFRGVVSTPHFSNLDEICTTLSQNFRVFLFQVYASIFHYVINFIVFQYLTVIKLYLTFFSCSFSFDFFSVFHTCMLSVLHEILL